MNAETELKTNCESAAYRAGVVHAWLEPILRNSLAAERAYAFKGRKKTADDIFNKVQGRHNHEDAKQRQPHYRPADVTDASGFRIVKLFNAEVPQALNDLLSLLKTSLPSGKNDGRLKGGGLNGVREIEFHTSRRHDDPLSIYKQVKAVVELHGLELRPPSKASSYSSVHVLLACEVGQDVAACSEIQLRSVFEEAWSEISHRLKYAPAKLARALNAAPGTEHEALSDLLLHLDALKSLTDGCAQYADLVNRQLQSLASGPADREPKPLDSMAKSAAMFKVCGVALHKLAVDAYRLRTVAVEKTSEAGRATAYLTAANAFKAAIEAFPKDDSPEMRRLHDVLREELAFCYMFTQNEELRNQAERLYRQLMENWPERVSILLRLGQLRRDAGAFAEAKELMEKGLEAAANHPDPDPDVQRQAIWLLRRDLAYVCWSMVDLDPNRDDAVPLLHHAIELSQAAQTLVRTQGQDLSTRQNMLYYLIDLWKRLPPDQRDAQRKAGVELLQDLRTKLDLEHWNVDRLDTMVRGEAAFGDPGRAREVAEVVRQRLSDQIAALRASRNCSHVAAFDLLSRDDRDMYLNAQDILTGKAETGESSGAEGNTHT